MGFEVDNRLESLRANGRYRTLRVAEDHTSTSTVLDGKPVHIFSSNDYLGLATDPIMKAALTEAGESYGMGPRAAALICGYTDEHRQLEVELARLKQ
ncbi:MAG: 8-amino-7-oxononanoate synthase, partial [Bradymonadia bacterium]